MPHLRPLLARIVFSRVARSRTATAVVALGVGLAWSYALGLGFSALQHVGDWQNQHAVPEGPISEETLHGTLQPMISVIVGGERLAFIWRTNRWHDFAEVIRYSPEEFLDLDEDCYPFPDDRQRQIEALQRLPAGTSLGPVRSELFAWANSGAELQRDLPAWAARPRLGSSDFDVRSWAFGWPFRSNVYSFALGIDPSSGSVEMPPFWETRTEELLGSSAVRPIVPGLLGNAIVWGGVVGCGWWMAAAGARRWLVRGGRCAFCGYRMGGAGSGTPARCPECGSNAPESSPSVKG